MANNAQSISLTNKAVSAINLGNMLASTTYSLNKSNTKRAVVGLDCHGRYYKVVIKLCSPGSPSKYVTLDTQAWELILDQLDEMSAYLKNSFSFYQEFGKPTKLCLPYHDINFTMTYGERSIVIDQRPLVLPLKRNIKNTETEDQRVVDEDEDEDVAVNIEGNNDASKESEQQQPTKKRRLEHPPGIVMQQATFEGLREASECINARVKWLEKIIVPLNRTVDTIIDFLTSELKGENIEDAKHIVKNIEAFKQFYTLRRVDIHQRVKSNLQFMSINFDILNILLLEIHAYSLPVVMKELYESMYKDNE